VNREAVRLKPLHRFGRHRIPMCSRHRTPRNVRNGSGSSYRTLSSVRTCCVRVCAHLVCDESISEIKI
jgi:hypothetical protein